MATEQNPQDARAHAQMWQTYTKLMTWTGVSIVVILVVLALWLL
jgi:hypothetical protein